MFKNRLSQKSEDKIVAEIERLLPAFRSFAAGLCGDRFVADDLVQASCERALERLDQVRDFTGIGSWINRIIYTQWQDLLRKRKSRRAKLISFGQYRSILQKSDRPGDYRTVARLDIEKGLDRLSDDHRAALSLVTIAGHNYQEASVILDVPVGTVASRVARAKAQLAEYLYSPGDHKYDASDSERLSDEYNR
ncbi:MAG: RNA polymerase sigma factor [Desulfofustis sp.]|nr:RNA polymerase sigma factor [Desulfofustis sp.]NNK58619.1 RNA polymerase sigma factor [Desulfofustis sp.]